MTSARISKLQSNLFLGLLWHSLEMESNKIKTKSCLFLSKKAKHKFKREYNFTMKLGKQYVNVMQGDTL